MSNLIKSQLDYQSGMVDAERKGRNEGLEEGFSKGLNQASFEIARKMKNAGRPFSEIVEFTGLTLEAMEKL